MSKNRSKILIVTADHNLRTQLEMSFVQNGFQVFLAPSAQSALLQVGVLHPNLIILDALLPDIDLAQELCENPVLLLASPQDQLSRLDKISAWASRPLKIQDLYDQVHSLLNVKNHSTQAVLFS